MNDGGKVTIHEVSESEAERAYYYTLRSFAYWRPVKVFVRKGKRGRRYVGGGWVR